MASPAPFEVRTGVVTLDVLIEGRSIANDAEVLALGITRETNRIPTARLTLREGRPATEEMPTSDSELFIPGKKIQINLGYRSTNRSVFKGIIVKHAVRLRENGLTELQIECRDEAVRMTLGRQNRYFEEQKDSEIIEELIGKHKGLQADVTATTLKYRELVQFHATDWDFILTRAEANGLVVLVEDGSVVVKKPKVEDAQFALRYGADLLEFEAEMDARTQWKSVRARGWDYAGQALFESETDSADFSENGNIAGNELAGSFSPPKFDLRTSGYALEAELQSWAEAAMLKSRMAKIRGRAKIFGLPEIMPGQTIELRGVGQRFEGKVWVSAVRHDVSGGAWSTSIQFGLAPDWLAGQEKVADMAAGGLLPPVRGLQIGKVVQLESDPDGEHRIQVRLPTLDNEAKGIWCRVASLDAGQNRGAFFRPEVDDEVVVGFLNDDPRDAIVLGQLHSSAKPAPIEAKDVNHEKGFRTREGMWLKFEDDKKKITISTPAGNIITLDEDKTTITIDDQNGNSMHLKPAGIEVKSPGNIKIEATGSIEMKAGTSFKISGLQVEASAQTTLEVKGSASAKLSSPGIAEISGSLVKIN